MTTGFAIHQRLRTVSPDFVDAFRRLPVANVSDCMSRLTAAGPGLRPMHRAGNSLARHSRSSPAPVTI